MFRQEDVNRVLEKYPEDITILDFKYGRGIKTRGTRYKQGEVATDEWGCQWHVAEDGVAGEVKEPPLKHISEAQNLAAPYEILDGADFAMVNRMCAQTDAFTLAWTTVRPFERMQFLLGTEKLFVELLDASKHLYQLRNTVHNFFMEEIGRWVKTDVDGISLMDDWGSQRNLLISPQLWEDFFKPLYKDYCHLIHSGKKYAFLHSDGNIEPIYAGLIEAGVDAVNSQLFCMDMEDIGRKYRGRITFWGEIDRQHILPFGTKRQVADAVRRVKDALWMPEGGIIAQCEFGLKDPVENIEAVFETWESIA
ncbi:MAG TPA: uroporphyrinogen decarboxylase family protein [Sedimentisphaerales bacterium]|nr:uroporphyrinogen decarboxylase family protein [Sedimentisphaerales bacterium]